MLGVLIASSGNLLGVSEEVKTSRERDVLLAEQDVTKLHIYEAKHFFWCRSGGATRAP
jgi:hypothetical protein